MISPSSSSRPPAQRYTVACTPPRSWMFIRPWQGRTEQGWQKCKLQKWSGKLLPWKDLSWSLCIMIDIGLFCSKRKTIFCRTERNWEEKGKEKKRGGQIKGLISLSDMPECQTPHRIPKALSDFYLPPNCFIFVFQIAQEKPRQYPGEWLAAVQRPVSGISDNVEHKCPGKRKISRHKEVSMEKQAT